MSWQDRIAQSDAARLLPDAARRLMEEWQQAHNTPNQNTTGQDEQADKDE